MAGCTLPKDSFNQNEFVPFCDMPELKYLPVNKVLMLFYQSSAQNPQLCFDSSPVAVQWNNMPFYAHLARYESAETHEQDDTNR